MECSKIPRILEIVSAKLVQRGGKLFYEGDESKLLGEVLDCAVRDDGSTPRLYILLKDSKGERYLVIAYLSYDGARNASFVARVLSEVSIEGGRIRGELEPIDIDHFASALVDSFEDLEDILEPPEE